MAIDNRIASNLDNYYIRQMNYSFGNSFASSSKKSVTSLGGAVSDSVEISDEARLLADSSEAGRSLMQPAKTLTPGTAAYDAFHELMADVKTRKADVMSRIESVLADKGINLAGKGTLKLEVDKHGKILVGGLTDSRTARAAETALNNAGLGKDIAEYQKLEKKLSKEVNDYTGCSLYELTMTSQGNISDRIRSEIENGGEYRFDADYYMNLGFLGSDIETIGLDDVSALSFSGNIDFSGEVDVMSNPEGNIKDAMGSLLSSIETSFAELNEELAGMSAEAGLDEEGRKGLLLSLKNARITIDSDGGITIDGKLSTDQDVHKKGVAIIERLITDMLSKADDNSYHINKFQAASQSMLERSSSRAGSSGKVVVEMTGGFLSSIREEATNRDPAYMATKDKLRDSMASVLRYR